MNTSDERYPAGDLVDYASSLLTASGLEGDKAKTIANVLVEGDLLGHSTHGLALLPGYLDEIDRGSMARAGEYSVLSERPGVALWDGKRLPGPWLTWLACEDAIARAQNVGTGTVVIRRSHHIACLAAYLERVTATGMIAIIESSDPAVAAVAPYGGTRPLFTPNPIAVGLPTGGDPILIDVSMSITTVGMARRMQKIGQKMPGEWLLDGSGNPTDDPNALDGDPPGSLMLLGGLDAGHKGFGLALMIEALTSGLGGFGRADAPSGWGASVFVQVLDPQAFCGRSDFDHQMDYLVEMSRMAPPSQTDNPVRLPGERGLARKRQALANGVVVHPGILASLASYGARWDVSTPKPVS